MATCIAGVVIMLVMVLHSVYMLRETRSKAEEGDGTVGLDVCEGPAEESRTELSTSGESVDNQRICGRCLFC